MTCLHEIDNHPAVQLGHPYLEEISAKFPSFRFFYENDRKTLLNTANSLAMMQHLIDGTKKDYEELIRNQQEDILSFSSFHQISVFFYQFKIKPDLAKALALFIYLDGVSRTEGSKKLVYILPAEQRGERNRNFRSLSIVNHELLSETKRLNLYETPTLRQAFLYRLSIMGETADNSLDFGDDTARLVQAATICDVAGLVADTDSIGASKTLTEEMATRILDYIEKRYDPLSAKEFCSLTLD